MNDCFINRRAFLATSSFALGALVTASTRPVLAEPTAQAAVEAAKIPTVDTRMKFNLNGSKRPFRGNTVICHLQPQGAVRDAVDAIREDLAQASFAAKVALLPTVSYHMTVYPGANDQGRELTGWPSFVPAKATIDECNRAIAERMQRFHLGCELPLRMKVDAAKTVTNLRATTLRMISASAGEEAKIRGIRDRLVDAFGFQDKSHDAYGFHITLAYQLAPFTGKEQLEHQAVLERHVPRIEAAGPVFEFGNPEFCTFPDMFRFDIQILLAS